MTTAALEAIDVDHRYRGQSGWSNALGHFSLTIPPNELLCILGPGGCGKSTFPRIVAGLTQPAGDADLYPYQRSGGMKHRVAVARTWALADAALLLMDEPFSAIDTINRMTSRDDLINAWADEQRTVVHVADRIVNLKSSPRRLIADPAVTLPWPRDRHSAELLVMKSQVLTEMRRHGILPD